MKLIRFVDDGRERFGAALDGRACAFEGLAARHGVALEPALTSALGYLDGLPSSFEAASALCRGGAPEEAPRLDQVRLLAPLSPRAMLDFGLTPRHLRQSAATLLRHELGWLGRLVAPLVGLRLARAARSAALPYYKCNHLAVIGDDDELGWPSYAWYLDVEPELAFVTGPAGEIAGYLIFDDASARDVQLPEMIGTGPARSKDFARSKGLGPLLVTPDEIPDPRALAVTVRVGDRLRWRGHTSEYARPPEDVVAFLREICPLPAGVVVGLGTVPDCTGLDHDAWIRPGERIEIEIAGLGVLRQRVPARPVIHARPRWRARTDFPG